uniref:Tf2-1-like SH3-like domain-containing protein n=2 Tax=Brassica oleracea TaxID=3712 RepID=A0A0D2ZSN3_BRAOL|nr:unnamed protein product [Brassica oleracea]
MVKQIHAEARRNLEEKTKQYARQANKGRREMVFDVGDQVWVHLRKERFPNERKSKLMPRIDGPFTVTHKISNNAYKLDLQGKYDVSDSFNVSDLAPFVAYDPDLRKNPFQEGVDDVIMGMQHEPVQEEINSEDILAIPEVPMTRARSKKLKEAVTRMLKSIEDQEECLCQVSNHEAFTFMEFSPTS